jgi:hypothetical protein
MRKNLNNTQLLSRDFFDGYVFRFIQSELAARNEEESGLGNYYAYRVRNYVGGVQDYEAAIVEYLIRQLGLCRAFVHIGTGIGTTPALIAALGYRVIGIESDSKRFALATALRQSLIDLWPNIAKRYTLLEGSYPEALDNLPEEPGADCGLFFTNLGATRTDEDIDRFIQAFRLFGHTILDLRLFCRTLESEAERVEIHNRILKVGMTDVGAIKTAPGCYYRHYMCPSNLQLRRESALAGAR